MKDLRVLYDGWSLVHAPLSPHAIHLQAVLTFMRSQVEALVALPQEPPVWLEDIETYIHPTSHSRSGRLRWEQLILPRLAHKKNLDILHLTAPAAPLLGDQATLVSPCGYAGQLFLNEGSEDCEGFSGRLRCSLARGGMSRIVGFLWPDDLPHVHQLTRFIELPPWVPVEFRPTDKLDTSEPCSISTQLVDCDLPETFILYHGPGEQAHLVRLVEAWKWAAPAISDYYPLVAAGLSSNSQQLLNQLAEDYDLDDSLCVLSEISPMELPEVYRRSYAVFHPAPPSPWSGAVRLALATGRPLIAAETDLTDAIVGPAAYLAPQGDGRALGAALVTVVVEGHIAEQLSKNALQRSISWRAGDFEKSLLAIYSSVMQKVPGS